MPIKVLLNTLIGIENSKIKILRDPQILEHPDF